jgi:ribose 5-phosphate isomerase B
MLYFGADHQGFELKELLKDYFQTNKIELSDCGNVIFDDNDDYPDFAFAVAQNVSNSQNTFGILICRSGEGMVMAANKVKGIRAALCHDIETVKLAKLHNNANILVIDSRHTIEDAIQLTEIFINTEFSNEERHIRRIQKISEYENNHIKD